MRDLPLWTRPFDAGRAFAFGGGGLAGLRPWGCGGMLNARRNARSMRWAISSAGLSSDSAIHERVARSRRPVGAQMGTFLAQSSP